MKNIRVYLVDRRLVVDCHLGTRRSAMDCPACRLCVSATSKATPFTDKAGVERTWPCTDGFVVCGAGDDMTAGAW